MAQREKGGRVVFIGNIPYGVSEEQICEIFGRVGQVVNFRLVYDKETSRPKGFGFLEYTDVDAAASAVRNLNEFEIMGRTLRVDYSNDNGGGKKKDENQQDSNRAPPPPHFNTPTQQPNGVSPGALPPLPQGADIPAGLTAPDAISKTLSTIPPPQLLDILSQFKSLSQYDPAQATALLAQAPQLGYAIFQALLQLGMVDPTILGSLITQQPPAAAPPQQQAPPPQQQPPPQPAQPVMPYGMPPGYAPQQPPLPQYGPPMPQQQLYQQPPQAPPQHYAPTPPLQQPAYQPPPPPPQQQQGGIPPQTQALLASMPPEQQGAIAQVLAMSREQVLGLPEGPRQQIMAVRQQFGMPVA